MSSFLHVAQIHCPYCGELLELIVDTSGGNQDYIEDCHVCCSPIELSLSTNANGDLIQLKCARDGD